MIDSRRLAYFLAVVDCEGLGRVAKSLGLSQATLSAAIHGLESELGFTLFHRVGRNLRLSSAGEDLVPIARDAVATIGAAEATARSIRDGEIGTATVAATASTSFFPLTDLIAVALREAPALSVRVVNVETSAEAIELLLTATIELALVPAPVRHPDLVADRVAAAEFQVAVPAGLLTGKERLTLSDLDGLPMLGRQPGSLTWLQLEAARQSSISPRVVVSGVPAVSVPRLVGLGVGAAFVPASSRHMVENEGARVLPMDPPFIFDVLLARRRGLLSPASEAVICSARTLGEPPVPVDIPNGLNG